MGKDIKKVLGEEGDKVHNGIIPGIDSNLSAMDKVAELTPENRELLLKILREEFEESYKVTEQDQKSGRKYPPNKVVNPDKYEKAAKDNPMEGCFAGEVWVNSEDLLELLDNPHRWLNTREYSTTILKDGNIYAMEKAKLFTPSRDISTARTLLASQPTWGDLNKINDTLSYALLHTQGYEHGEFLNGCAQTLLDGGNLSKEDMNKLNNILGNSANNNLLQQMMLNKRQNTQ